MFTGLVETIGTVLDYSKHDDSSPLVETEFPLPLEIAQKSWKMSSWAIQSPQMVFV